MRHGYLLSILLLVAASAQAGVVINGTRLVYQGDKRNHLSVFQTRIPRIIWCSPGSILAVKPGQSPVPDHPAAFSTGCERG